MTYYLPILGAVALAGGTILERIVLRKKKVGVELYQTASFLAIIISLLPLLYFFWKLDSGALESKNILIFSLVILFATIANLLVFYSLKGEKVVNLEPARVLEPLFVILLAIVFSFFVEGLFERNLKVIVPALIASLALVFSHIKRHHLKFNPYFIAAIFGSLFFALELVISRLILDFYSPVTFYFLRSSSIFLLSLLIFRPDFKKLDTKVRWQIFATGFIWMIYRVVVYYGYVNVGVIFTTLILMLGPIFIYAMAHFILKEKISWRNFTSAIIIVGSVIYALV
ncbi:MAG: EamA family transporter [Nanoarchaeota archaeon]|nr:EamA family transporter [Nanoarchaeota archaeon]